MNGQRIILFLDDKRGILYICLERGLNIGYFKRIVARLHITSKAFFMTTRDHTVSIRSSFSVDLKAKRLASKVGTKERAILQR